MRPARGGRTTRFLLTIDTEGDNLWAKPRTITTRNAEYLPRFQALCERYGLRPTYLTTHEMALSPAFQEFGRDVLRRGTAEIGAHPHAWNTPPLVPLTEDDLRHQPFLIEYPEQVMGQKLAALTHLLEDTFGLKMVSHRAGRWSFNETYARLLVANGYLVDCSVTPLVSWRGHRGNPNGEGGSDFSRYPTEAYFVDLDAVDRPGTSPLLEVPMTIVPSGRPSPEWLRRAAGAVPLGARAMNRLLPRVYWLRPDRRNGATMIRLVRQAVAQGRPHVEFMVHSSELMPGGSPLFPTTQDIERLYRDLEALLTVAAELCTGLTLREFYAEASRPPEPARKGCPA